MPWVHAKLRGQTVFARADGRLYRAMARNLEVADRTAHPDDYCAPAEAVEKPEKTAATAKGRPAKKAGAAAKARAGAAAPTSAPGDGTVIAYADGACTGNPGPAGLGVVVIVGEEWIELSEYLGIGTNNIAELTAILRALDEIGSHPALIHTDSQYAIGVAQKGWKAKANQTLVAELRGRLTAHGNVRLVYVPGHSGVPLNERADALARDAVAHRQKRRTAVPTARRLR